MLPAFSGTSHWACSLTRVMHANSIQTISLENWPFDIGISTSDHTKKSTWKQKISFTLGISRQAVELIVPKQCEEETNLAIWSCKFSINSITSGTTDRANNCSILSNQCIQNATFSNIRPANNCNCRNIIFFFIKSFWTL